MIKGHIDIISKNKIEKRVNGRPVYESITLRSCMAEIMDLYGQELYSAMSNNLQNTIIFKIRYCKSMDILRTQKEDYRVIYNSQEYSLYQVDYAKYNKQYILLKCMQKKV